MRATSLRAQLTRAAMLTMLLATLLSAGALLAYELLTYQKAWGNDLRTQADLISRATAAALVFNDPKVARENLALLKARPGISAAAIYGPDGSLVATYGRDDLEQVPSRPAKSTDHGEAHFSGSNVEMTYPIEQDGERVGTLYLRAEHNIWPRLLGYAIILGAIGVGSLGFAYYVFDKLQLRVTTPLVNMTQVAQEVVISRNWALRAPETQYEDVRVLVEAFNAMLAECGSRTSELERAQRELLMADRRKDEFLATLAHELRNPLAPMMNAVSLMQMPTLAPEARSKALVVLDRQLRHMVRLIDDLLDASRIATGKLSLVKGPVDVVALVRAATELAEPSAIQNGLTLSISLPADAPYVDGDTVRLSQIFSNLLSNACRYTPRGGTIEVTVEHDDTSIEVSIRDSGIGVAPEMQDRIFELFEQVNKSLERGTAGLGIGLTLTRQLVQLHGGTVSMTSGGLGMGSCFTVSLPLLELTATIPSVTNRSIQRPAELNILVADDNVDLAESFAALLQMEGHHVEIALDGEAALKAALARVPDIALLDVGMPGRNGYDVARLLRSNGATKGIYLVAITGWGQPADKAEADAAGFDLHLVKPVEPDDILRILPKVFLAAPANRRARDEAA